ncbi:threonine ammonia-lyase, biosynthetic [Moraxella bovis]|uniref:L-threonine dehydratase n=1 Tax=Moraxella bovis TaxID=476 RepID=A0A1T0A296_MORBO|nr:threonine ammonia-lyase, biosynthetic [Moraxella bovis]AWY19801.1 threonine ammonia-lyase, biosynthetic [Moraxella bovis]OOR89873.1 threonine ammonia-lyase, biosynthetic [Moraxella bovis]UYZ75073.1 threonine ammonia-lyase, biosynthetic [Moraxella bovis]UYZ78995.1 threonine ammonia-lyase, biosynthetic [Moraxella bovis]UYZ80417.1 threonine ammonia-lyase, biosynthetic [Moraxella bovis]
MTTLPDYVRAIITATVYDVAIRTPLDKASKLSARFGNDIRLKREDLQPVFSFKVRGAYNKISQLSAEQKAKGIICASAGNHAQGVAYSANRLKINNLIVMPKTTPDIKVQAVKAFGGTVHLHGDSFDEANRYAMEKATTDGMTYIAPYDDKAVIAGQGTVALELSQDWREMEYVFVPVGGGGLVAGIASFLGEIAPHIKVIAVESEGSACLKVALADGERTRLPQVSLFADGVAVAQIGQIPFEVANLTKSNGQGKVIDAVITCNNDEICASVKDIFEENRHIVEPSGALALAGLKKYVKQHNLTGKNCVAIVSGANMNFDRLRYIAERTEIGENKEAIFAVQLPEKTGAFLDFCRRLQGRNITEFNYRLDSTNPSVAQVFVGIGLKDGQFERTTIMDNLDKGGYTAFDLTDDEVAKTHIRYLIGGHGRLNDEKLFRVMFPERPNALLNFLEKLGQDFNVTLFHYRNHGAAEGRVLVGLQATAHSSRQIVDALTEIGYDCEDLSENVGYGVFLK